MTIDVNNLEYDVELITETGIRYELDGTLLTLNWEEQESEIATRATLSVANFLIGDKYLMQLAKLNCGIIIYAKWGADRNKVFEGTIWDWTYTSDRKRELTVMAYDPLIRLQNSKDYRYYSKGQTTPDIIKDICGAWGIPVNYRWNRQLTHEKKAFKGGRLSDMIIDLLDEVKDKTGEKYTIFYRDGALEILARATNNPVYYFPHEVTTSTSDKKNLNKLVTRVKVIGKEDSAGRNPVEAQLDGDTRFGVLQEIILRTGDKTLDAANSEAQALIKERGQPDEQIQATVPDIPFLRKGDRVQMAAGDLLGFFYVTGVSHNATQKQMTMTLTMR
ncbi:MAG: hypothetical protein LBT88_07420 [Oscillospiraceae bacterium]|jgi:hypothetical protein|nr:hypothetical protein [Oscillospiraceae bacterium]